MVLHSRRTSVRLSLALVDCMSVPDPFPLPKPLFQLLPLHLTSKCIPPFDEFPVPKGPVRAAVIGSPAFNAAAPIESTAAIPSGTALHAFAGGLVLAALTTRARSPPVLDLPLGHFQGLRFSFVFAGGHSVFELTRQGFGYFFRSRLSHVNEQALCQSGDG